MRTKTLVLTALLGAAGVSSALGQAVTSKNIVGYINLTLKPGYSLVANQLNNGANKVADLFAGVPNNTSVFKFTGTGYQQISYVDGSWEGDDADMTVKPGEGVFVNNPTTQNAVVTLVGEVQLSSDVVLPSGGKYAIISSAVPQAGGLSTSAPFSFPLANNDVVFQFTGSGYKQNSYVDGSWEGDNNGDAPAIAVGESFFFQGNSGARTWHRDFAVN